jgi:hypothetical protein
VLANDINLDPTADQRLQTRVMAAPAARSPRPQAGLHRAAVRASGLNLVIAAIVYWNSTYFADAVAHLQGKEHLDDALLAHTTPLTWEDIGFSGDFLWDRAAATPFKRRPLNLRHMREAA